MTTKTERQLRCDKNRGGCGTAIPFSTLATWLSVTDHMEKGVGEPDPEFKCPGCKRTWGRPQVSDLLLRLATLPDPKTLARRGHPTTSKVDEAFLATYLPDARKHALAAVQKHPGKTCSELADAVGDHGTRKIGRRLNELEKAKLIRRGDPRRCSISGRSAATWFPVH